MKKVKRIMCILLVLVTCLGVLTPAASAAVVKKGSSGTLVRQVQYNLNALGFNVGSVDGMAGNNTVNGIRNYQKSRGLAVDGMAGPATQNKLWAEIKDIQTRLKRIGCYSDSVDGIAGPNTISGIKKFQKLAGLKQTGVADKTTVKILKDWPVPEETFTWPLPGYTYISSPFGNRYHPTTGNYSFHCGIDIGDVPTGTPVRAAAAGKVSVRWEANGYGNYVIITHSNGLKTLYAHMASVSVKDGATVSQGDVIGKVGSTGRSTGPHLHFEVYDRPGNEQNPLNYVTPR